MLELLELLVMREDFLFMNKNYSVEKIISEVAAENTYLCINTETNEGILIDPATLAVDKKIVEHNVDVQAIFLTHAHFDHILEVDFFAKKYDVPVYIHENEKKKLTDPKLHLGPPTFIVETIPHIFKGGNSTITVSGFPIEYFLAPGHSEGNSLIHIQNTNIYFVGDSVFEDSIGRYDFPGSNTKDHVFALRKFQDLAPEMKLYPGHGKAFYVSALEKNEVYQRFIKLGM